MSFFSPFFLCASHLNHNKIVFIFHIVFLPFFFWRGSRLMSPDALSYARYLFSWNIHCSWPNLSFSNDLKLLCIEVQDFKSSTFKKKKIQADQICLNCFQWKKKAIIHWNMIRSSYQALTKKRKNMIAIVNRILLRGRKTALKNNSFHNKLKSVHYEVWKATFSFIEELSCILAVMYTPHRKI